MSSNRCSHVPSLRYTHTIYIHIVDGNGGYTDRQLADYIKEMSSVAKATNMNEHKKATGETVNGKWPVAMETL